ncbi:hypothetical protein VTN96DRAFT_5515 [Rasamsonia emersonii]
MPSLIAGLRVSVWSRGNRDGPDAASPSFEERSSTLATNRRSPVDWGSVSSAADRPLAFSASTWAGTTPHNVGPSCANRRPGEGNTLADENGHRCLLSAYIRGHEEQLTPHPGRRSIKRLASLETIVSYSSPDHNFFVSTPQGGGPSRAVDC